MTTMASIESRVAVAVLATVLLANVTPAAAEPPANGQDIDGRTVYLQPGGALRSGPNLTDAVVLRATDWVRLRGAQPPCTNWNCKVHHAGQELFARRSRLDLTERSASRPGSSAVPAPTPGGVSIREKLVRGDEGEDVRVVQEALVEKGYRLKVNGRYGDSTEDAVRDFQRANGLSADGRVGPLTREKLLQD
jgi:murein L,D-transpeptidase YcbB/YkuD